MTTSAHLAEFSDEHVARAARLHDAAHANPATTKKPSWADSLAAAADPVPESQTSLPDLTSPEKHPRDYCEFEPEPPRDPAV